MIYRHTTRIQDGFAGGLQFVMDIIDMKTSLPPLDSKLFNHMGEHVCSLDFCKRLLVSNLPTLKSILQNQYVLITQYPESASCLG